MLVTVDDAAAFLAEDVRADGRIVEPPVAALRRAATSGWPDDIDDATDALEQYLRAVAPPEPGADGARAAAARTGRPADAPKP